MQKSFIYLLLDVGNSNTLLACLKNEQLADQKTVKTKSLINYLDTLDLKKYQRIIISSVVPEIDTYLKAHPNIIWLNHQTIPEIRIDLDQPEQVGADRLVNAYGAYRQYQKKCLIMDKTFYNELKRDTFL